MLKGVNDPSQGLDPLVSGRLLPASMDSTRAGVYLVVLDPESASVYTSYQQLKCGSENLNLNHERRPIMKKFTQLSSDISFIRS